MALSEAAVIAERAGLDLSRVLQSWELSLAGSRVLGVGASQTAQSRLPTRSARRGCTGAARSRGSTSMANRHFSAAAGKRARTLSAVGSSRPQQSGSDVDLPVPSRTAPRAPRSTGLAAATPGVRSESREGGPGGQPPARLAGPGSLRSGELKNHYHQNDDDQDTDDGSDNSPVHGQDLLSGSLRYPPAEDVNSRLTHAGSDSPSPGHELSDSCSDAVVEDSRKPPRRPPGSVSPR